ncbi:MAG: hypothetical protein H7Z16_04225 [Pyrinomonadaceae bacterium]|nr:hypothetical protein [Pyrinomonadaceae bacterium]
MKFAPHGAAAQAPGRTNSVATGFETVPVGNPPGTVIPAKPGFFTNGVVAVSRYRVDVLVPAFATQNGLEPVSEIPQGLTNSGSWIVATPGRSET